MKITYRDIGPRLRVPYLEELDGASKPLFPCRKCGVGLEFNYDGDYQACKDHQEELRVKGYEEDITVFGEVRCDDECVCPYCFHGHSGWPHFDPEVITTETTCEKCGKTFNLQLETRVKHCTWRKKDEKGS